VVTKPPDPEVLGNVVQRLDVGQQQFQTSGRMDPNTLKCMSLLALSW
jgi:hypothetical protein